MTQKKRNIDLEKNLNDRNRKNNEKYDKEQFAKRQQRIKESRFEYERALLENELKKVKKIINIETWQRRKGQRDAEYVINAKRF